MCDGERRFEAVESEVGEVGPGGSEQPQDRSVHNGDDAPCMTRLGAVPHEAPRTPLAYWTEVDKGRQPR